MISAGFIASVSNWRWTRQFPGRVPRWGEVAFEFECSTQTCDIMFVHNGIHDDKIVETNTKYLVFLATEPPNVKQYHPDFLDQFDLVVAWRPNIKHNNLLIRFLPYAWYLGAWDQNYELLQKPLGYDDFIGKSPAKKNKLLSVVSSNKTLSEQHKARLEFVRRLKRYFGDEIDFFGRGINEFGDKSDVLEQYRYHIAIENIALPNYWTEKLCDPLLSGTYPIYYGCPNIQDYFGTDILSQIDIYDFDSSVATIRKLIDSDVAEKSAHHLQHAKHKVLNEFNLFAVLADIAAHAMENVLAKKMPHKTVKIYPERYYIRRSRKFWRKYMPLSWNKFPFY